MGNGVVIMSGKKIRSILTIIIYFCFVTSSFSNALNEKEKFIRLADQYFDTVYFPTHPSTATDLGIHKYDTKLENYSQDAIKQNIKTLKKYETLVSAINPKYLDEQTAADRELLLNKIKQQLLTLEVLRPWEKKPDFYASGITTSAYVLLERKFAAKPERLRLLIAREKLMPNVLQEAHKNLKNPPKVYTDLALEELPALIHFFQFDVPFEFKDVKDQALQHSFTKSNHAVIRALEDYQVWLKKEVLPHSNGDFRMGAQTLQKKLKYEDMIETPLDTLVNLVQQDLEKNQNEFAKIAKQINPDKNSSDVLSELLTDHPKPDQLLTDFRSTFPDLIQFIKTKNILTIPPGAPPIVQETPPFLRAITFASIDVPGPFEKVAKDAYLNVTLPDKEWDQKKTDDLMAFFNYPGIKVISIHETYPGHHIQFLWSPLLHDRIRKIISAGTNSEGWAHYCEQMMLDEGYVDKLSGQQVKFLRLSQLYAALLRDARVIVSIQMHRGMMTFDQAIQFFQKNAFQTYVVSSMETKRAASNPSYQYTLGKLAILKLRADLKAKEGGDFQLKRFHDQFMQQGRPPIKIVRKALLHDDSPIF